MRPAAVGALVEYVPPFASVFFSRLDLFDFNLQIFRTQEEFGAAL